MLNSPSRCESYCGRGRPPAANEVRSNGLRSCGRSEDGAVADVVGKRGGVISGLFSEPYPACAGQRRSRHGRRHASGNLPSVTNVTIPLLGSAIAFPSRVTGRHVGVGAGKSRRPGLPFSPPSVSWPHDLFGFDPWPWPFSSYSASSAGSARHLRRTAIGLVHVRWRWAEIVGKSSDQPSMERALERSQFRSLQLSDGVVNRSPVPIAVTIA